MRAGIKIVSVLPRTVTFNMILCERGFSKVVFRVEGEFGGRAAKRSESGASDERAGDAALEIVKAGR